MKTNSKIFKFAVGYTCLIIAGAANAAVAEDSTAPVMHMGGVEVYPGITALEKNDSNPFRQKIGEAHNVTVLSPSVMFQGKRDADDYSLTYKADVGNFTKSGADNYLDHSLLGAASVALSSKATLSIKPEYKIGHDDRGSNYDPALGLSRNDWKSSGATGSVKYGSEESMGKIELTAGYTDKQYQNNRAVTTSLDKKLQDMGATFHYRVMPKTTMFLQVNNQKIAYKDPLAKANGTENRYMIGATWDATAQTSGTFKLGQQQKKFDNGRPTFSGAGWEGNIRWSPRDFARVDFIASNKTNDSPTLGNYILSKSNGLDFSYDVTELTTVHLKAAKSSDDFVGNVGSVRKDNLKSAGIKAEYKIRKWLIGGVEYSDDTRTSTDANSTYQRKIIAVNLRSEL
jgi:hypothetical protein